MLFAVKFNRQHTHLPVSIAPTCAAPTEEETTPIVYKPARPRYVRRFGLAGRLEQILIRHCPNEDERHKLLEHAEGFLTDKAPRFTKNWNESLLHELVTSIPRGEQDAMASRRLMQVVLQDGVDLSFVDSAGDPPLLKAVKARNRVAVDMLLRSKCKCDVNSKDRSGRTCLVYAAYTNDEETLQQLLQLHSANVMLDASDFARYTALAYAASGNNMAMCRLLLDAGANPNASSVSPLYLAVKNNCSFALIELLVTRGSSVTASVDFTGLNVLTAAAKEGRADVVTLLLKFEANCNKVWHRNLAFISALQKDHVDVLQVFIDHGVSVQPDSAKGINIAHEAAAQGSSCLLSYIVSETGINLNQQDRYGKTPFYLAAQNGHEACMDVLFRAGVNCCTPDNKGQTPLETTLFHNQSAAALFFVKNLACPRHVLFSTLQVLEDEYDSVALSKISAFGKFKSALQDQWCQIDQMESLTIMCVIVIRQCLGQRGRANVTQLPLPSKVQKGILKMTRS